MILLLLLLLKKKNDNKYKLVICVMPNEWEMNEPRESNPWIFFLFFFWKKNSLTWSHFVATNKRNKKKISIFVAVFRFYFWTNKKPDMSSKLISDYYFQTKWITKKKNLSMTHTHTHTWYLSYNDLRCHFLFLEIISKLFFLLPFLIPLIPKWPFISFRFCRQM